MMNKITFLKYVLLTLVFIAVGAPVQAVENPITFTVDGISYKQFAEYNGYQKCVYVTPSIFGKYEGAIVIPDSVSFDGHRYKVLGIGDNSFKDCTELTSVQMDAVVVFIGNYAFENCTGLQELTVRLNTFWIAPSPMSYGIHVGYRAFFGCRLKSFTLDAHDIPPYYTQMNPSNDYNSVTNNQLSNWFDGNDYWNLSEYPYRASVWSYTTCYVPAGHGTYYNNSENYNYRQWGEFFSTIKEFGADADDNVFGMKCDTIPELIQYVDNLRKLGHSQFAYVYLMQYIDSIAQAEGKEPDYSQLEAAFDKVEMQSSEMGTYTMNIIPEINNIIKGLLYHLEQADELCDNMEEPRKKYYEAKNEYEIHMKNYPDFDWERERNEIEAQKAELDAKIAQMTRNVDMARASIESLRNIVDSLFEKEMWDFINAFKLKTTGIRVTTSDVQSIRHHWYTLDGQRLEKPMRGINIIDGKKIIVR